MKKLNMKIWAAAVAILLLASSCSDFLDINENPNSATSADVNLVLPQAIVASASIASQYNNYGGHFGGYIANAGGFSGFGTLLSYNLTPADYNGLWTNTYQDPLRDFKYVIDKTEGDPAYAYFNAAAKIMSAYLYMKLVDTFGDIPYTQALRGEEGILTPTYDDAQSVYADLVTTLDEAIALIDNGQFSARLTKASDPLFGGLPQSTVERNAGDIMLDWKRFANTLKLKMFVRTGNAAALAALPLTFLDQYTIPGDPTSGVRVPAGSAFITDDAVVDPGYELNRPNPAWATWGRTPAAALSNSSRVPTKFSYGFYGQQFTNGSYQKVVPLIPAKILDPGRGRVIYVNFTASPTVNTPGTPTNQLGNENDNPPIIANQVTWAGSGTWAGLGVLKGPGMGQPLMLLAEQKFLLAEAQLNGDITGSYITTYYEGVTASFTYLYKNADGVLAVPAAAGSVTAMVNTYKTDNAANALVVIENGTTDAQRLEAIITQKYIAMNMVTSDESYNEYRRTGYPATVTGGSPELDIASNKSTITERADRLPTRVMYPSSESAYNASNYRVVNYRADRIFWDPA